MTYQLHRSLATKLARDSITMKKSRRNGLYRQLVVATLLMGGAFNLAAPVLAAGTAANTGISNTATATYEDPNNPGTINATSNTVTITVAEVAGITAVPLGVNDSNGGSVSPGDTLEYNFRLTNVGNAASKIFVPGKNHIVSGQLTITKVEVELDNNGTITVLTVPVEGLDITNAPAINPDASIKVKVTGTVSNTAAPGSEVKVLLGNTGANDNSAATQNQPDDGSKAIDEIYTVDSDPAQAPVNGVREASVYDKVTVATQANQKRALVTVRETSAVTDAGTSAANDNKITYNLNLKVESTSPNASFIPSNLEGTTINLNGNNVSRILVSDVIPTGTVFDSNVPVAVPTDWTVVYSTTPINGASDDALAAQWTTTKPTDNSTIKRIGFIYTGSATSLTPGTTANGFTFGVISSTMPDSGGNVANIAQVFGETEGDTNNIIVYDESGDSQPNNFNSDGTTPYPDGAGGFDPNTDNGKADPATQGTDTNNTNTGSGVDGEANVVTIAASPIPTSDILNGPANQPGATGLGNSNNTDFFNKSVTNVPANSQAVFDPGAVSFNNTFKNSGAGKIDNLVLRPIAPSQADFVADNTASNQTDPNTGFGTNAQLPDNTQVTISYNGSTASYTWHTTGANANTFTLDSGSSAIRILNIAAGTTIDYTVKVDLAGNNAQLQAFPVAIAAFVDEDSNSNFDRTSTTPAAEPFFNLTVDRVYTGYMKLVKMSRVLKGTGPDVPAAQGNFNSTPTSNGVDPDPNTADVTRTPVPGNIIEYQINYTNISTPASAGGNGSVLLDAKNLKIFEDGTGANGNNWAASTTHVLSQAIATSGTVSFYNNVINTTTPGTGVAEAVTNTGYVNFIGTVAPNAAGTFTFQRQVK